jgi:hypothetical protein
VVCHAIGLETGSASQDYIQLYEGDAKLLTASLEHIQKAASQILDAIGAEGSLARDHRFAFPKIDETRDAQGPLNFPHTC